MIRDWTRDFLQRSGVLAQGPAPRNEAACIDARGSSLFLAPLGGRDAPPPETGRPTTFQVPTPQGFLRVDGILSGRRVIAVNGVPQEAWQFDGDPETLERINRRAHYRVAVNLKGELCLFAEEDALRAGFVEGSRGASASHLERLAKALSQARRPCRVWDLGVGGARLVTTAPEPAPHTAALLDLALGPGETLRNLPGRVIECRREPEGGDFGLRMRLRFDPLGGAAEARLSKHVAQVQRDLLQKGIRG